MLLLIQRT